jgi:phosphoribosylamine--glycine ligase
MEKTSFLFHAGTKIDAENVLVTNGGRVITATSQGNTIKEAVNKSKNILLQIHFDGMYFRNDIGYEFE